MPDKGLEDIKKVLLQIKKMCTENRCLNCPLHTMGESNVPYCPMHEDADGKTINLPADWEIDDWEEDSNETD